MRTARPANDTKVGCTVPSAPSKRGRQFQDAPACTTHLTVIFASLPDFRRAEACALLIANNFFSRSRKNFVY